ncbi:MAG: alginate lyase family protein [Verrucomicrobia bacterium]|nr:alginate lyase family protein [Verrucomicrobiota bacterium]
MSAALFCAGNNVVVAATPPAPRVVWADPNALADAKARLAAGDPALKSALNALLDDAEQALRARPQSVMDKRQIPPSGDKHDYISQAPYFWPNTNSGSGRYIRRDGDRNPASGKDSDAGRLGSTLSNAHTLALAFYFTGNERYAAKAALLLRVFFLDPATKMNPNLNFGQGIPNEVAGRPTGLIGARGFVPLMDALGLLERSKSWTPADQAAMRDWLRRYFQWLTTSRIGLGEKAAKNNHGTFYDSQAAAIAMFLGKTDVARQIVLAAESNRIPRQILPDGRQPLELRRTLSFGYSVFNLQAWCDLAAIGQNLGIDVWHYRAPDGASILRAIEFVAPYADPQKHWPFEQIHEMKRGGLANVLLRATSHYSRQSHLADALRSFDARRLAANPIRLMFPTADNPLFTF